MCKCQGSEGGCSGERRGDVVHEVDVGNLEETTAKSETAEGLTVGTCAR